MNLSRVLFLLLQVLCLFSVSCSMDLFRDHSDITAAPLPPLPPGRRPEFWVEYYPYPCWQQQNSISYARPVPDYNGWTDIRMERDLERLSAAGFQAVLLFLTPEHLAKATTLERVHRFYDLAAAQLEPLRVGIVLSPIANEFTLQLDNVMTFFRQQGFADKTNALKFAGTSLLFFDQNVKLLGQYQGALGYVRFGDYWPARSGTAGQVQRGFTWVIAADNGGNAHLLPKYHDRWIVPRGRGEQFAAALRQAMLSQAEIICVSSWNNFNRGSFIEPNSLEYDLFFNIFQSNARMLAAASRAPAEP